MPRRMVSVHACIMMDGKLWYLDIKQVGYIKQQCDTLINVSFHYRINSNQTYKNVINKAPYMK